MELKLYKPESLAHILSFIIILTNFFIFLYIIPNTDINYYFG
jgi:hypothetical protein